MESKAAAFEFDDGRATQTRQSVWTRLQNVFKPQNREGEVGRKDGRTFPYRDGLKGHFLRWLTSRRFQVALQILLGVAFTSLFVFVRQLRFMEACLGATLALAGFSFLSPHPHIGCLLMTAANHLFCATYIPVYAGAMASLAYATGKGHYTGSLIAFGIVGFIPLTIMRASPGNPAPGIVSGILYGVCLIFTVPRLPHIRLMWRLELANLMAAICVAAAGIIIGGFLALPTLAGQQCKSNLAKSLRGTGQRLSGSVFVLVNNSFHLQQFLHLVFMSQVPARERRCENTASKLVLIGFAATWRFSSAVLAAEDFGSKPLNAIGNNQGKSNQDVEKSDNPLQESVNSLEDQLACPELQSTEAEFLRAINKRTDPKAARPKSEIFRYLPHADFKVLRAYLDECKLLILESTFEPASLQNGRFIAAEWGKVLMDIRSLLTRVGALGILVEGQQLMQASHLRKELGVNPLPSLGIVLAELSATCQSLSEAISHAGSQQAENLLTAISWAEMRNDLKLIVSVSQQGYLERDQMRTADLGIGGQESGELEARALLLLVCLVNGIISSIADLESSIPIALGLPLASKTRRNLGTTSVQRLSYLERAGKNNVDLKFSPMLPTKSADQQSKTGVTQSNGEQYTNSLSKVSKSEGEVRVDIHHEDSAAAKSSLTIKQQVAFLIPFLETVFGILMYKRLKPIVLIEGRKAFSSWTNFRAALQNRRVQFGFKFWLTSMTVFVAIVGLANNHRQTKVWRLYYGYITAVILMFDKVEAVVWKTLQRITGTLIGGTLAYLIMLRAYISSRGVAVDALCLTSLFVIANRLESRMKYSVFLAMLTLISLTMCQFGTLKMPGDDFRTWIERVANIVVCGLFATAMSWFILPWYASDNQLLQMGEALQNSAQFVSEVYAALQTSGKEAFKGGQETQGDDEAHVRLNKLLESSVVQPVEATSLSLRLEAVVWKRGFLSTPRIVYRLLEEMTDLIHRLTSLELAVTSASGEFGPFSAAIYHLFVIPLEADNRAILEETSKLTKACLPVLKHGPSTDLNKGVEEPLTQLSHCRNKIRSHLQTLKQARRNEADPSQKISLTPADVVRLGAFIQAICDVLDKLMLIARIIIDDSYEERETRISNLAALDGTTRDLGQDYSEGNSS